ncbi:MAG: hypothetical protein JO083_02210 [Candidatus Eremiobacteraeota bacterium]|nr:hypothetical protein [Candidatus Eremiobacteraeota bacterium]
MKLSGLVVLALAAFAGVVAFGGSGGTPARPAAAAGTPAPDGILAKGHINRVVVIVMENRTFDNVFGGDFDMKGHPSPYPEADSSVPSSIASHMTTADFKPDGGEDNWHNWWECLAQGHFSSQTWLKVSQNAGPCTQYPNVSKTTAPFKYLSPKLRTTYWAIAGHYELGDSFFAMSSTDSFPAHQYIVVGQSRTDQTKTHPAETVAGQPTYAGTPSYAPGCVDLGQNVDVAFPKLDPATGWATLVDRNVGGECWNDATFGDYLSVAHVNWQHFSMQNAPANAFNGFINVNGPNHWYKHVFPLSGTNVLKVAAAGGLPQFSWIKPPCFPASDHPNTGNHGPAWVETVIDEIGSNQEQWDHAAIFVIWDDWGGFYDHRTPPPQRAWDHLGPGLRTPFLIVSPYVVQGNVAHGVADYGSILRFVEQLYNVPSMGRVDAHSPDLVGFFNFNQTPRPFVPITTEPTWAPAAGCQGNNKLARD